MQQLIDSHCHLQVKTTSCYEDTEILSGITGFPSLRNGPQRCIMSTNCTDWEILRSSNEKFIGFGVHPWFSHWFSLGEAQNKSEHYRQVLRGPDEEISDILDDLPDPQTLEDYISQEFEPERVACIGEVGLDRSFRIPRTKSSSISNGLTHLRVTIEHQEAVLERFLHLAETHRKPVSLHVVQCQGRALEYCSRYLKTSKLCLHSYSGSPETLRTGWYSRFSPSQLFVSMSKVISLKVESKVSDLVHVIPQESLLTESDLPVNAYPQHVLTAQLEELIKELSKYWLLDEAQCRRLVIQNWQRFISAI